MMIFKIFRYITRLMLWARDKVDEIVQEEEARAFDRHYERIKGRR